MLPSVPSTTRSRDDYPEKVMDGDGQIWLILGGLSLIAVAVAGAIAIYRDGRQPHDTAADSTPTATEDAGQAAEVGSRTAPARRHA